MPTSYEQWMAQAPTLETDNDVLRHTYRQSLIDLAALRFRPLKTLSYSLPAAGLRWFMALLGRDSHIRPSQSLPFQPHLARTTLEALTAWQATEGDDFRDAEPGKILHELRLGELTMLGERPHSPYSGTHDATPLFLILLDEYERWAGDRDFVRSLQPAAMKALEWIEQYGDRDGDGYLEYETRSKEGLANQCWKDSWNSILFKDGTVAKGPIATCEIQGYAYDARVRMARLARDVWDDPQLAGRLESAALELRERFNRDYWIEARGQYALALDGEKETGGCHEQQRGASALVGYRAGGPRGPYGDAPDVARDVHRLGHPDDVGERRRLQPDRVPRRHRLAARHGLCCRGHAPLRTSRAGIASGPDADPGRRGVRVPAARGLCGLFA